jgi:hypothetical protein
MIVVRDIFCVKFGKMKDALAALKQGTAPLKKEGYAPDRILTDLTGPYYTLVMESSYASLSEYEKRLEKARASKKWHEVYAKFVTFVDGGEREIFTVAG